MRFNRFIRVFVGALVRKEINTAQGLPRVSFVLGVKTKDVATPIMCFVEHGLFRYLSRANSTLALAAVPFV